MVPMANVRVVELVPSRLDHLLVAHAHANPAAVLLDLESEHTVIAEK
jgi:hypothetical protein